MKQKIIKNEKKDVSDKFEFIEIKEDNFQI